MNVSLARNGRAPRLPGRGINPSTLVLSLGMFAGFGMLALVLSTALTDLDLGKIDLYLLGLAVTCFAISWLGFGRAWSALNGSERPLADMHMWSRTQLLRYVAGAIWAPAARASSLAGRRRDRSAVVVLEGLVLLSAAAAVAGGFAGANVNGKWFVLVPSPVVAIVLVRAFGSQFGLSVKRAIESILWCVPSWVLYAAGSAAAQSAIGAGPPTSLVLGFSIAAWIFGYVTIFAPGGAGAREVAYLSLLTGEASQSTLASGAIASRLTQVIAELLVLGVLGLIQSGVPRRSAMESNDESLLDQSAPRKADESALD